MLFRLFSFGFFILLEYRFASVLGHDSQKRLLLNDPDVAGQFNQMMKNMQSLTNQVSQLTSSLNDVKSELAAQKQRSARFTAGQSLMEYNARFGGPSDYLCLPNNPELSNLTTAGVSHLFGTEYEEKILQADAIDEDIPCAVCKSVNTHISIMIPGRETCYQGWKKEYNGLLASLCV
ncbi:unnamed protein product [Mytilus coruscus]|uniref:Uncharacterized protein n=1 Tax=Mytilus coruscus TaxID=42192 RepID=A0A6J8AEX6_MYTCO|nr:unnamed protein product [Mytilus coruscus]